MRSLPLTLTRTIALLFALTALGFVAFGIFVSVDDLRTSGEMFDGMGLFFGGAFIVGSLPALLLSLVVLRSRRTRTTAVAGLALAAFGGGLIYFAAGDYDPWSAVGLLVSALLAAASVATAATARPRSSVG